MGGTKINAKQRLKEKDPGGMCEKDAIEISLLQAASQLSLTSGLEPAFVQTFPQPNPLEGKSSGCSRAPLKLARACLSADGLGISLPFHLPPSDLVLPTNFVWDPGTLVL